MPGVAYIQQWAAIEFTPTCKIEKAYLGYLLGKITISQKLKTYTYQHKRALEQMRIMA